MVTGTSMAYVASTRGIDLPKPTHNARTAHKPWCLDCKRTVAPLDDDQRCERCARAHVARTKAAERRAAESAAAAATPPPAPKPKPTKKKRHTATFDVNQALTRFAAGEDATTIATDLGTTPSNLYAHASRRGIRSGQDTTPQIRTPKTPTPTQELDAQLKHATHVLQSTWNSHHPVTRALRTNVLTALEALHLHHELNPDTPPAPVPAATTPVDPTAGTGPTSAGRTREGKPTRSADTPTRPNGRVQRRDKIHLPTPAIEDAYTAGATISTLANQYDVSAPTIARHLDEHGVVRRKQKVNYTPELIEAVRTRYVDLGMTQDQVAADLDVTTKIVQTAMTRGGITARETAAERSKRGVGHAIKIPHADHPQILQRYRGGESAPSIALSYGASAASIYAILNKHGLTERHGTKTLNGPGIDHARTLREQLTDLGVTAREVKIWALHAGLIDRITRGIPKAHLIEAYANAHPTTEGAHTA